LAKPATICCIWTFRRWVKGRLLWRLVRKAVECIVLTDFSKWVKQNNSGEWSGIISGSRVLQIHSNNPQPTRRWPLRWELRQPVLAFSNAERTLLCVHLLASLLARMQGDLG
jgi:hypothetical protein